MRLTILYRENSDHARAVLEFIEMLSRHYPDRRAAVMDIDTREGAAEATLYGVTQYPALVLTSYEGRVVQLWEGLPLPIIDQVGSMIHQDTAETV